ncbi:hypothetical protein GCM10007416_05210 [Kroppenstedtia guangzhouensis]|uniref:YhfH-like protein n=1 Tax=Kroppenstedtia guangzhouensis TaxID=1274356 RepID=A0ABQ1G0X3_9BACL|nr:hypothetical protein GCM10007416_05210 [Kroppenstedtia guangzhouensis]
MSPFRNTIQTEGIEIKQCSLCELEAQIESVNKKTGDEYCHDCTRFIATFQWLFGEQEADERE